MKSILSDNHMSGGESLTLYDLVLVLQEFKVLCLMVSIRHGGRALERPMKHF